VSGLARVSNLFYEVISSPLAVREGKPVNRGNLVRASSNGGAARFAASGVDGCGFPELHGNDASWTLNPFRADALPTLQGS
jgi:hypothetical protein